MARPRPAKRTSATARNEGRRRAIEGRTPEIARLRAEANALLGRQPEARNRADTLRALLTSIRGTWARIERAAPALADHLRSAHTEALARWLAARHSVRPVKTHADAITLLGAAGAWTDDDVARALLDRPSASADELRLERRADADRKRAMRARDRYARAVDSATKHVRDALAVLGSDLSTDERARALATGWAVRCLWGVEWLGNAAGYPRSADAEHSMLIAADIAYRETDPREHVGQLRKLLVFVATVAVAHVGSPPETTVRVFAALKQLPAHVLDQIADTIVETARMVTYGNGAAFAATLDALLAGAADKGQ